MHSVGGDHSVAGLGGHAREWSCNAFLGARKSMKGAACLVHRAWRAQTARSLPPLKVSCSPLPEVATGKLLFALFTTTKR